MAHGGRHRGWRGRGHRDWDAARQAAGAGGAGRCQQTTYLYENGTFYTKAMHEGQVVYQVVDPPPGAIIPTLPAGCTSSGATSQCGTTHYKKVESGYQVVAPK